MPGWSGGTFTKEYDWEAQRDAGVNILASQHETQDDTFTTGINSCLNKDGSNAATANLDLGTFKLTNGGAATAVTDFPTFRQLQNSSGQYAVDSGAADAYVITLSPVPTAYATGQTFRFKATNANTGASTLNVNSLGAKTIKKDGAALGAAVIAAGGLIEVTYDGTDFLIVSPAPSTTIAGAAIKYAGKETIWVPARAMIAATTSGPAPGQYESSSNKINVSVWDFDATSDEYAHFNIAFPKSWNEGTVTYQVLWFCSGSDTDAVVWALEGLAVSDNETIDSSWGTAVSVTDNLQSAANEVYVSAESSAVTIAGTPAVGDVVFFRFSRDANAAGDTAAEDARLIGIRLFFTTNAGNDD